MYHYHYWYHHHYHHFIRSCKEKRSKWWTSIVKCELRLIHIYEKTWNWKRLSPLCGSWYKKLEIWSKTSSRKVILFLYRYDLILKMKTTNNNLHVYFSDQKYLCCDTKIMDTLTLLCNNHSVWWGEAMHYNFCFQNHFSWNRAFFEDSLQRKTANQKLSTRIVSARCSCRVT